MSDICEPANYETFTASVSRTGRGVYTLYVAHRHEGARSYCPRDDVYPGLDWNEVLEVMVSSAEGRRPGMHPAGWEQQPIW